MSIPPIKGIIMPASLPKPSTIVSWLFYLTPIYIFVLAPLLGQIFPPGENNGAVEEDGYYDAYDAYDGAAAAATSGLRLDDDSFISLDDGVPVDCPGGESDGYQVHLLSREPLVIYIEGFLGDWEVEHLVGVRYVHTSIQRGIYNS